MVLREKSISHLGSSHRRDNKTGLLSMHQALSFVASRHDATPPLCAFIRSSKHVVDFLETWDREWKRSEWSGAKWREIERGKPNFISPFQKAISACLKKVGFQVKEEAEIKLDIPNAVTRSLETKKFVDIAIARDDDVCHAAIEIKYTANVNELGAALLQSMLVCRGFSVHKFKIDGSTKNVLLTVNAHLSLLELAKFIDAQEFNLEIVRFDLPGFEQAKYEYGSVPNDEMTSLLLAYLRSVESFISSMLRPS